MKPGLERDNIKKTREISKILLLFLINIALHLLELSMYRFTVGSKKNQTKLLLYVRKCKKEKGGTKGWRWYTIRNSMWWIKCYAFQEDFVNSAEWLADFRIPCGIFNRVLPDVCAELTANDTNYTYCTVYTLISSTYLLY